MGNITRNRIETAWQENIPIPLPCGDRVLLRLKLQSAKSPSNVVLIFQFMAYLKSAEQLIIIIIYKKY